MSDALKDLRTTAKAHSIYLTVVCWNAFDLVHNPVKRTTHFLALTLSRNPGPTSPRTLHSLIDVDAFPLSMLTGTILTNEHGKPYDPLAKYNADVNALLADPESAGRIAGGMLVVCIEVAPKDGYKSAEQALKEIGKVQRAILIETRPFKPMHRTPQANFYGPENRQKWWWKTCLKNALDGYAFAADGRPVSALEEYLLKGISEPYQA
ncbi:hypothetical protein C8F01DRAFT_321798 [Mycena amicta]|nr:hypothetical protein C8F01DRAFT_321798 [Mycena amicta]